MEITKPHVIPDFSVSMCIVFFLISQAEISARERWKSTFATLCLWYLSWCCNWWLSLYLGSVGQVSWGVELTQGPTGFETDWGCWWTTHDLRIVRNPSNLWIPGFHEFIHVNLGIINQNHYAVSGRLGLQPFMGCFVVNLRFSVSRARLGCWLGHSYSINLAIQ